MPSTLNYSKWDSLDCDDDDDDRRGRPRVTRLEPGSQITIGSRPPAAAASAAAAVPPARGGSLGASYSKWDSMQVDDDSDEEYDEEYDDGDDLAAAGKEAITHHVQSKAAGGPSAPAEPRGGDDDSAAADDSGVGHGGDETEIERLRAAAASEAAAPPVKEAESKLQKLTRNGAHRDGYLWRQTEADVLLSVLLPSGTRGPAMRVNVRKPLTAATDERARVVVAVRGAAAPALDAELAYPVELPDDDDELDWEVTDFDEPNGLRLLQLTLRKQVPHGVVLWWTRALKGEEPLDASALQDRRQRLKPGQEDPWKEAMETFKARISEHGMPPPPP